MRCVSFRWSAHPADMRVCACSLLDIVAAQFSFSLRGPGRQSFVGSAYLSSACQQLPAPRAVDLSFS